MNYYRNNARQPLLYTPAQVAEILQVNKNTVYDLIERGEVIAKKLGRFYRIPRSSLSFVFEGLDEDIFRAEQTDRKNLDSINKILKGVRAETND